MTQDSTAHTPPAQPKRGRGRPPGSLDKVPRKGRPLGSPYKCTIAAREAIGRFVDDNCWRLSDWLDEVHEANGAAEAMKCLALFIGYHVPKQRETAMTGAGSAPLSIVVEFVPPAARGLV